jgi:hypothetical protein
MFVEPGILLPVSFEPQRGDMSPRWGLRTRGVVCRRFYKHDAPPELKTIVKFLSSYAPRGNERGYFCADGIMVSAHNIPHLI